MNSKLSIGFAHVQCCKCERLFDSAAHRPQLLNCWHFICRDCIEHLKLRVFFHCYSFNRFFHLKAADEEPPAAAGNESGADEQLLDHHDFHYKELASRAFSNGVDRFHDELWRAHRGHVIDEFAQKAAELADSCVSSPYRELKRLFGHHLECSVCGKKYRTRESSDLPVALPCWHAACLECVTHLNKKEHTCRLCSNVYVVDKCIDVELIDATWPLESCSSELVDEFSILLQQALEQLQRAEIETALERMQAFFDAFDARLVETKRGVEAQTAEMVDRLEDNALDAANRSRAEHELNARRELLIKRLCADFTKTLARAQREPIKSVRVIQFHEDLSDVHSLPLVGELRTRLGLVKRLSFAHLLRAGAGIAINCQRSHATPGPNKLRPYELLNMAATTTSTLLEFANQLPSADQLVPLTAHGLLYAYSLGRTEYKLRITDHRRHNRATIYLHAFDKAIDGPESKTAPLKVLMCRFDPWRRKYLATLIELKYSSLYLIEVFKYVHPFFSYPIGRRYLRCHVENVLVCDDELIVWCPYENEPIQVFRITEKALSPGGSRDRLLGDFVLDEGCFALDDASAGLFAFHNQQQALVVDRRSPAFQADRVRRFAFASLGRSDGDDETAGHVFDSFAKIQLVNVRLAERQGQLVIADHAAVHVCSLADASVLCSTPLSALSPELDWSSPYRMYVVQEGGDGGGGGHYRLAFFDASTTNLTFI